MARLRISPSCAFALPLRPRTQLPRWHSGRPSPVDQSFAPLRQFADSNASKPADGSSTDVLPSISEEAAAVAKATGRGGPDIEQGTPVQDVVKDDIEAQKHLPKVMLDELKAAKPTGSRSYSTSAFRREQLETTGSSDTGLESAVLDAVSAMGASSAKEMEAAGVKFGLPSLPLPPDANLHYRYHPVVQQVVGLLMRHGKKATAQRNVNLILAHLRTAPPPVFRADRPLAPGHPPPSHLPLNPVLYLTLAIDSAAPLMRIVQLRGAAGGGVSLPVPKPLNLRQRRRAAIRWIIDAAAKRRNHGSGKGMLAKRIAEEMIAVVEGRSSVWEKRNVLHKLGVSARANMSFSRTKRSMF
ncbi:ribosomal protein S7 [Trichodelitschia bisporula]|uniref:Small ribosomal subunit protein uS7m n=1 Tax=Trichodelitschia bisporula TaxID=703511 RepID=A0A6G1HXZ9_9PEZI|nr:ribosomal protein S7 [Trichodelitschia bisporula]